MNNDDEQTARDLIGSAFADAMAGAPTIETPTQLLEMVASALRDEAHIVEQLRAGLCALLAIEVHELGQHSENKHAGVVGVHLVSFTPDPTAEHLLKRLTGDGSTAYALLQHAQPDNEPDALLMMTAAPTGALLGTIAQLSGPRIVESHGIDIDSIDADNEHPETTKAMRALVAAASRKPAEQ
jgi:hypothetical protein